MRLVAPEAATAIDPQQAATSKLTGTPIDGPQAAAPFPAAWFT